MTFATLVLLVLVGCREAYSVRQATAKSLVRSQSTDSSLVASQQILLPVTAANGAISAPLRKIIPEHGSQLWESASRRKLLTPYSQSGRRLQQLLPFYTPQSNTYGVVPGGGTTYSGWQTPAHVQPTTTTTFRPTTDIWGATSIVDTQPTQHAQPPAQQQPAAQEPTATPQQTVQPAATAAAPTAASTRESQPQPAPQVLVRRAEPRTRRNKPAATQPASPAAPTDNIQLLPPPRRPRHQRSPALAPVPQPAAVPAPQLQPQQPAESENAGSTSAPTAVPEPTTPAATAAPATPATPEAPATPAAPAVPATPATPAEAAVPALPATPAAPVQPATPAAVTTPETPAAAPAEPATPATVTIVLQEPEPLPTPTLPTIPPPSVPQQTQYCIPATRGMQFNVLAAGDSITQGSVPSKNYNHPYTIKLKELLRKTLGKNADCTDAGLGGGGVFEEGFHNPVTFGPYYWSYLDQVEWNVAVISIGINDLLRGGYSAVDIMNGLQPLYEQTLAKGIPVIAMPPFAAPGFVSQSDPKEAERKKLAALITDAAAKRQSVTGGQGPQIYVLDLQAGPLDFWKMSESDRSYYLDDGLHMTEMAYDLVGQYVYETINALLCTVENPTISIPDPHNLNP